MTVSGPPSVVLNSPSALVSLTMAVVSVGVAGGRSLVILAPASFMALVNSDATSAVALGSALK
jgi:hypothetical protein